MVIKNGFVLIFEEGGFVKKDIKIEGKKILEVSENIEAETYYDASGMYITPGLIDAHSHIGVSEEGAGSIGDDCNDYSDALMPYLEAIDAFNPYDIAITSAVKAGITTACTGPGSDSVVGGVFSTMKLWGNVADEMVITRKASVKCSFGENPKTAGLGHKSRMGTAYILRKCLEDAIDYRHNKHEAMKANEYFKTDIGMENMLLVLDKKVPFQVHAHRADDICTAIRIAREYDVRLVLVHCTDGHLIVDYISKFDYPVILGPSLYPRSKSESLNRTFKTAAVLHKAGVKICITADHDVTPIYFLPVYAAQSVKEGLPEIEGLKAITKNAAEVLGIQDIKGEIKAGFDADIVVWDTHPFDYKSKAVKVWIEGQDVLA
ncbi:Imidazolonepropionase [Peptoclostridium litorale DSM 5388]|uniref:Amidohydrolase family protein n=1 Tax=Peptoclostridium litorale DSM 5388 TaxID=1121324 RepID=A0A069RG41_PEPLI|nr:amidohydrolase family protein [Peptoclostridium litorale]KDR95778.1 amidohydrolase family protein [Peptoclostridium litorale DSM 5388]SIO21510.1 Imidazolonepropionase [Peptoclostridium litorale DSM 5388]